MNDSRPDSGRRLMLKVVGVYAAPALVYAFALFAIPPLMDAGLDASIGGWIVLLFTVVALAAGVRAMRRFPTAFGWVAYGSLALTIVLNLFMLLTGLVFDAPGAAPSPSLDWLVQASVSAAILWAGFSMLTFAFAVLAIAWAATKASSGGFR